MKLKNILACILFVATSIPIGTQAQNRAGSSATQVTRSTAGGSNHTQREVKKSTAITDAPDSNIEWSRIIYRHLDLDKDKNAPLYFAYNDNDGGNGNLLTSSCAL